MVSYIRALYLAQVAEPLIELAEFSAVNAQARSIGWFWILTEKITQFHC